MFFVPPEEHAWYELLRVNPTSTDERYIARVWWLETYGVPTSGSWIDHEAVAAYLGVSRARLTFVTHMDGHLDVWDSDVGRIVARLRRAVMAELDASIPNDEPLCPRCGGRGSFVRTALKCVPCDQILGGF
jgi:hypothetical protein